MSRQRYAFALIREGTSDDGLIPHLSELLVRAGLPEVFGSPRDYPGPTLQRLARVSEEQASVDLIFVHRDADAPDATARRTEIAAAVACSGLAIPVVSVVPIQELEAWLLVDEAAIRAAAGKPSGTAKLQLPKASHVERNSSPKEILQEALIVASETAGRRRKEERKRFSTRRRVLLERLDIDGPIRVLTAWQQLESDIASAVASLSS